MKKRVIVTLTTSIIVVLAIGTMLIVSAQSSYRTMEKKATNLALQQGLVNGVTNAYVYNGSLAYITVLGIDEENERKAVFVPANFKKKAIQEVWLADGISKSEAIRLRPRRHWGRRGTGPRRTGRAWRGRLGGRARRRGPRARGSSAPALPRSTGSSGRASAHKRLRPPGRALRCEGSCPASRRSAGRSSRHR